MGTPGFFASDAQLPPAAGAGAGAAALAAAGAAGGDAASRGSAGAVAAVPVPVPVPVLVPSPFSASGLRWGRSRRSSRSSSRNLSRHGVGRGLLLRTVSSPQEESLAAAAAAAVAACYRGRLLQTSDVPASRSAHHDRPSYRPDLPCDHRHLYHGHPYHGRTWCHRPYLLCSYLRHVLLRSCLHPSAALAISASVFTTLLLVVLAALGCSCCLGGLSSDRLDGLSRHGRRSRADGGR